MIKKRKIELLDCTLRDGGLGLEDALINGISKLCFSSNQINELIKLLELSRLEIIELGSIEITDNDKKKFSVYQNIEEASNLIKNKTLDNQKYALLYRGPDTPIEDIPDWNEKLCKYIRVIIRYSELQKSLDFCRALSSKGYKVFIQPMVTTRYTDKELQLLIDTANLIDAYALYIVDSYGYVESEELKQLFNQFDDGLNSNVAIGLHGHNNMNLGFSNVKTLLEFKSDRHLIIDTTLLGMGQGAGNVQTELLAYYMNSNYDKKYNKNAILDGIEIIESFTFDNLWGYSVVNLLPAVNKTAYKYAINMRNRFGLTYAQIDLVLSNMPNDLKYRYTLEDLEKLLAKLDIKKKEGTINENI